MIREVKDRPCLNGGPLERAVNEAIEALRRTVEEAISAAEKDGCAAHEAINWSDLHCTEVRNVRVLYPPDQQYEYIEILIEEASPFCADFKTFLYEELRKKGFTGVQIVTEW